MQPSRGKDTNAPVAIIGLSCRFPGEASTPSGFWELLKHGRSGFSSSTNRYNADAFQHSIGHGNRQNVIPSHGGFFLEEDPYVFDAAFFNITAAEAAALDPRQRIAMEVAYESLENAGMSLQKVAGSQTACFMGSSMSDYRDGIARDFAQAPKYHILGISDEMIANRISHFFDIHGPSATVQSACSSSLVATHLACQSLRSGESDIALAGGVGMILSPDSSMHLNNLGFLNPAGQSRSFDIDANGYGRGEGCGILVMKRLDQAIADGDNIRAIIRGSGVNSDGWTQGVTMPSGDAQAELIRQVYESNGLEYAATQYVEAHGTGTKAGDPIETQAIYRTIGQGRGQSSLRQNLWIGSVKPNIGHLEAAAGVASIIKGVLALEHGLIPPNINFSQPNPAIPLAEWKMSVPTKLISWPPGPSKRMSISGFGMGGTNGHIVLEGTDSATKLHILQPTHTRKRLFVFSSHDKAGFERMRSKLVKHLDTLGAAATSPEYLANFAYTLAAGRAGLRWKATCTAATAAALREQLLVLGENAVRAPRTPPRIGLVFTGQGAQWARMGVEMMDRPVFSESVKKSSRLLEEMGCLWDAATELLKGPGESRIGEAELSQPLCTVLQIALVDELRAWGIRPAKVVGHSSGEIGAAYTIGALSHRDALAVAYFRGRASANLPRGQGGMMAVGCSREEATKLLKAKKLNATVACVNSPVSVTLSGDAAALDALQPQLDELGIFARRLKVDVAYHSSYMSMCSAEYYSAIEDIGCAVEPTKGEGSQPPVMVSSVTGRPVDTELLGPYYWIRNLMSPVLFTDALSELVSPADANAPAVDILLEVGPHGALGGPVKQILADLSISDIAYHSMLTRGQNAQTTTQQLASDLFHHGVALNMPQVNSDASPQLLTDLPPYAWNHSEAFRADSRLQRERNAQPFPTRSILGAIQPRMDEGDRIWRGFIRLSEEPWLRDHTVGRTIIFPGAGMVSLVLEAAHQFLEPGKTPRAFRLRDVSFLAALTLSESFDTEVITHIWPHRLATTGSTPAAWWEFTISACAGVTGQPRDHCRGLLTIIYEETNSLQMVNEAAWVKEARLAEYQRVLAECPTACSQDHFYRCMSRAALPYGPHFRGLENCRPGIGQAAYDVRIKNLDDTFTRGKLDRPFFLHAAALDAVFQGWLASTVPPGVITAEADFGFDKPMVPAAIGELNVAADLSMEVGSLLSGYCVSKRHSFNEFSADLNLFDGTLSKLMIAVEDFRTTEVDLELADAADKPADGLDSADMISEVRWECTLDTLPPAEIQAVISKAGNSIKDVLLQLIRMIVHTRPGLQAIELSNNMNGLAGSFLAQIPPGILHPSQIRYALIEGASMKESSSGTTVPGTPFALDALDDSADNGARVGLFIILGQRVTVDVLGSLLRLATKGAIVITIAGDTEFKKVLGTRGFIQICPIRSDGNSLALYRLAEDHQQPNGLSNGFTNGSLHAEITVLEPNILSTEAREFSFNLRDSLQAQGVTVRTVDFASLDPTAFEAKVYISLLELDQPFLETLPESAYHRIQSLMTQCKELVWITAGDHPAFGMVDGLARCVNAERSGTGQIKVLHLTREGLLPHGEDLVSRVLHIAGETEFREVDGLIQVPRFYCSPLANDNLQLHLKDSVRMRSLREEDNDSTRFFLTIDKPGLLDTVRFAADTTAQQPLGDDEVELLVKATGVNFRDVMASMGLVPVRGLGQEVSGIVVNTGRRAGMSFQPGDRVCAVSTGGTHATRTRCDYRVTCRVPDSLSFEEAAASPMAHATAYYALVQLARLRPGQSVLIHAAAGGVGQAAVQLATHLGLDVYATVGTPDKRKTLQEQYGLSDTHIFNSRDGSFLPAIRRITNGRGVDCVLNSLSGELLRLSWYCLATFGTFVEIGLRDITDNMRLDMRPFGHSTTFTFFNIQTLIDEDPARLGETLHAVFDLLQARVLRPPSPITVLPAGKAETAFRQMQLGKHRGKLVLSFNDSQCSGPVLHRASDTLRLDPNATYLLVGGLGGLGRSVAHLFVASGARNLAILSRSGASNPSAQALLPELSRHGATVRIFQCDISDVASFNSAMKACEEQLPSIRGVIQLAMVLRDGLFETMSYGDWTAPLRPKVAGSWNLHDYFDSSRPLDFLVFCSSISGLIGNPGQAQYSAGNTYQDKLAHVRRSQGLAAVSVNLGIMLDVGVIAEAGAHNFGPWEDSLGIREGAFHALLRAIICAGHTGPAQVSVGLGTADRLARFTAPIPPPWFRDVRFAPLTVGSKTANVTGMENPAGAATSLASRLRSAVAASSAEKQSDGGVTAAAAVVSQALIEKMADTLRIPSEEVDATQPMYHYGVDSLVALEIRNWISREMHATITLLEILQAVPMQEFAKEIAKRSRLVIGGGE